MHIHFSTPELLLEVGILPLPPPVIHPLAPSIPAPPGPAAETDDEAEPDEQPEDVAAGHSGAGGGRGGGVRGTIVVVAVLRRKGRMEASDTPFAFPPREDDLELGAERHLVSILVDDGLNLELPHKQRHTRIGTVSPRAADREHASFGKRTSPESAIVTSSTGLSPRPFGTASIALMTSICGWDDGGGKKVSDWRGKSRRSRGGGPGGTDAIQDLAEDDVLAVEPFS